MNQKLDELRRRLREVGDLRAAASVLHWDQTTYMPPKGAVSRGRHIATLERLAHAAFTDAAMGALLDDLQPYADSLPPEHPDAALVRVTRPRLPARRARPSRLRRCPRGTCRGLICGLGEGAARQ